VPEVTRQEQPDKSPVELKVPVPAKTILSVIVGELGDHEPFHVLVALFRIIFPVANDVQVPLETV
jgi:hypothetical protein